MSERGKVDGQTKLVGIIGYPLRYTLSPVFQNAAFYHLKLNWCYLPLVTENKYLEKAVYGVRALSFVGVNITMPYKQKVIPLLDEVSADCEAIEAVNTIHLKDGRLIGYNTDGAGFLALLKEQANSDVKDKKVMLIGAGGAARAVAAAVAKAGVSEIYVVNRTFKKAVSLCEVLKEKCSFKAQPVDLRDGLTSFVGNADIIINATSVGMKGERLPLPYEKIGEGHLVCDLIYAPSKTPLLEEAEKREAKVLNGLGMLIYQGALSFKIWTGEEAPVDVMFSAAKKALAEPSQA